MSYAMEDFKDDVVLFNTCCSNKLPTSDMSSFEVVELLRKQLRIINSEVKETFDALVEGDIVEVLDGTVDVAYTMVWFEVLLNIVQERKDGNECIDNIWNIFIESIDFQPINELFSYEVRTEAMRRIAKNNNEKFTTDVNEVSQWRDNASFSVYIDEVVVDGVKYYCIKDEKGKVRKHSNFIEVDLSDLV